MKVFENSFDTNYNLLPFDGLVNYYGKVMDNSLADRYFEKLLTAIEWRNDEAMMFGKRIITKRKVAWYGDKPFEYTYSKITKHALPWNKDLLELKHITEQHSGEGYNSCLLNLYHSGEEGMTWHSDDEPDLKRDGAIASLSFGAERRFAFKHKRTGNKVEILLEHGSLLVMKGSTQTHWLHRLPLSKKIAQSRINLTFRTID